MDSERWKRTEEMFAAVLEQEPERRAGFLEAACADDKTLRAEVESLLAAHARAANFIEAPASAFASGLLPENPAATHEGKRCGPYRLIREIGRGGMGEVYLAARDDDQYQKQVAIKLVRRGMDTDTIILRFLNERQILAGLDHPNIARLLDGGTTGEGLPWLAMEYIEGEPIDVCCDRNQLSIADRLKLFRTVCAAVHYAHQNLVIHRDLKPSNILVTADGTPKLLDFGIAKILAPDFHNQTTAQEATAMRLMTPSYASPEQIKGATITTSSDVYSLGVILYELLSGHRPYHITGRSPHEIERIVCEEEPTRPSLAVTRPETSPDGDVRATITPEQVGHARNDQPKLLRRQLAGDLDNIVLTALRKEPQRRYASVEQFSEDIQRHLDGMPVMASRDTFAYRSAKFMRRNKAPVAVAALVAFLLVSATVVAVWQAGIARARERDAKEQTAIAWQERDRAGRIDDILRYLGYSKDPDVNFDDAIRYAEKQIENFKDQPEIRGEWHWTLGGILQKLRKYDSAELHFRAILGPHCQIQGRRHPRAIQSIYNLGMIEGIRGNLEGAVTLMRRSVEMMRLYDPQNEALPWMTSDLSQELGRLGKFSEAETLILEARETFSKMLGTEDHRWVSYTNCRLGNLYRHKGEPERARTAYLDSLERLRRQQATWQPGEALFSLGVIDYSRGNYQEAEKRLNEADKVFSQYLGANCPRISEFLYYLASIHCLQKDYARAEFEARRALENSMHKNSPDHPLTIISLGLLSKVLISSGRPAHAAPYLREAMEKFEASPNRSAHDWFGVTGILGECLTLLKRYDEAERLLIESYTGFQPIRGEKSPDMLEARQRLVKLYEAWGKNMKTDQYR